MLLEEAKAIRQRLSETKIPGYMHGGIVRYIIAGIKPGDFLTAVLSNDLSTSAALADDQNRHLLFDYACMLHNVMPYQCWGSPMLVKQWIDHNGMLHDGETSQAVAKFLDLNLHAECEIP